MKKYSGEEIIEGILSQNEKVIYFIYEENYRSIKQFVKMNNGNDDDADDIFQEAMIVIFRKVKNATLNLYVSFNTYLYAVAKKIWLRELKRRMNKAYSSEEYEGVEDEYDFLEEFIKNEKHKLVWKHFEKLGEDCKKIIQLFIDGLSISEVTGIMNYSTEQHTKNRRLRCKNNLVTLIINDSRYKELMNEGKTDITQISRW